jgi:hypothetical protein
VSRVEKQVEFLERLIRATEAGKVRWAKGKNEFWFRTEMSRFTYAIESRDEDDLAPYDFHIYRTQDVPTAASAHWAWDFDGTSPVNERLRDLYLAVKHSAVGFTDVLEGMLQDVTEAEAEGEVF